MSGVDKNSRQVEKKKTDELLLEVSGYLELWFPQSEQETGIKE